MSLTLDETAILPDTNRQTIITDDGYVVDAETGETLDILTPDELRDGEGFTEAYALWVLEKWQEKASKIAAYETQRDRAKIRLQEKINAAMLDLSEDPEFVALKARVDNAERIIKKHNSGLDWLDNRYSEDLKKFVQRMAKGIKQRYWDCVFGRLQLRAFAAKVELLDMDKAVEMAYALSLNDKVQEVIDKKDLAPEYTRLMALATDDKLSDDDKERLAAIGAIPGAVQFTPAGDKLTVSTGVGK